MIEQDPFASLDEGDEGELNQIELLIDTNSDQNDTFLPNSFARLC